MKVFDYNLLRVLAVLLEERNVTSAAQRLCLSQSAVSKQLAKLREAFGDPLFERESKGLMPTPKVLALAPKVYDVLRQLEQLTIPEFFKPEKSHREYHFDLIETAYTISYPQFMPTVLSQAPHVCINSRTWGEDSFRRLLKREIDFGIGIFEWDDRAKSHVKNIPAELKFVELRSDYSVCVMRSDHPAQQEEWNLNTFLKYRHIQVNTGGIRNWLLQELLGAQNRKIETAVNMTDFRSAIKLCEQSDLFMCYPISSLQEMTKIETLTIKPIPLDLKSAGQFLLWHQHYDNDPSHKWLRDLIIRCCKNKGE